MAPEEREEAEEEEVVVVVVAEEEQEGQEEQEEEGMAAMEARRAAGSSSMRSASRRAGCRTRSASLRLNNSTQPGHNTAGSSRSAASSSTHAGKNIWQGTRCDVLPSERIAATRNKRARAERNKKHSGGDGEWCSM